MFLKVDRRGYCSLVQSLHDPKRGHARHHTICPLPKDRERAAEVVEVVKRFRPLERPTHRQLRNLACELRPLREIMEGPLVLLEFYLSTRKLDEDADVRHCQACNETVPDGTTCGCGLVRPPR